MKHGNDISIACCDTLYCTYILCIYCVLCKCSCLCVDSSVGGNKPSTGKLSGAKRQLQSIVKCCAGFRVRVYFDSTFKCISALVAIKPGILWLRCLCLRLTRRHPYGSVWSRGCFSEVSKGNYIGFGFCLFLNVFQQRKQNVFHHMAWQLL